MDGVLLESRGYHRALQKTIRLMALALGFAHATISPDEIAAFEAGGISSEWDEAAIVTARLLEEAWKDNPHMLLPDSLSPSLTLSPGKRPWPNLASLAYALSTPEMLALHPLERAARFFFGKGHRTAQQEQILHDLILGARLAELSLTHRTFQELVLGSSEYYRTYNLPAEHNTESYLLKYDRSNLSDMQSAHLCGWISQPGHAATVITSRPSRPPAGVFSTPEAELGAQLVGLEGIPILGWGGMRWLGLQTHIDPQSFLKPSPVHALAGMRMALGERQEVALTEAADLVENGLAVSAWKELEGAEVSVFEDTPGGIKSLQAARGILKKARITIVVKSFGIAQHQAKTAALSSLGAQLFPTLVEALEATYQ